MASTIKNVHELDFGDTNYSCNNSAWILMYQTKEPQDQLNLQLASVQPHLSLILGHAGSIQ